MYKHFHWRAAVITLIVIAVPAIVMANHSWGGYHWARTSNPFTLKVGDNVNATWDAYLDTAIGDWTQSTVLNMTKVAGSVSNLKRCSPPAGRVEVCNASYGNNGWLGIAGISVTGGTHITQGYVKLNDTYFNTAQYNTPAWRRLVSCQELGHTIGLDHQDENFSNPNLGTCMDYTNAPAGGGSYGPSNEYPNQHDYDELQTIYSHLDSTTTVGASVPTGPSAMQDIDQEGPGQWGRLVSGSRAEGHSTYVLDFGNGNKKITHVFWVSDKHLEQ